MIKLKATIDDKISIDSRNAISMERNIQDRSDFELPSFGIISNSGSLKFVDTDGSIRKLAEYNQLKNGMYAKIELVDTLSGISSVVGTMLTQDWNYDVNNKQVSVKLHDGLSEWQNIQIPKLYYSASRTPIYGYNIYRIFHSYVPSSYNMLSYNELDSITQARILSSNVRPLICDASTLWSGFNEFCQFLQLHIYRNGAGQTVCKYNGGN